MNTKVPFWLYPNILSLDAPIVALVWMWVFCKAWYVSSINPALYILIPCTVWIIYISDRVLDVRTSARKDITLQTRHAYHKTHSKKLILLACMASCLCVSLLPSLDKNLLRHALPAGLLVVIYFALATFCGGTRTRMALLKNAIAGLTFSYGVSCGVHFSLPEAPWNELLSNREYICFGVLCFFNITAIDCWESPEPSVRSKTPPPYPDGLLFGALCLFSAYTLFLCAFEHEGKQPYYLCITLCSVLIALLDRYKSKLSTHALRGLVDLALILPAPLLSLSSHF